VLSIVLVLSLGSAQGIGLKAVGGGVGFTSVSFTSGASTESLSGLSLSGQVYMGDVAQNIGLYPEIVYWSASKNLGSGVHWSVSDFAINANARYDINSEGNVKPYVGAGLGINFLNKSKCLSPFSERWTSPEALHDLVSICLVAQNTN
jgi:opacity protein-like surface antigen